MGDPRDLLGQRSHLRDYLLFATRVDLTQIFLKGQGVWLAQSESKSKKFARTAGSYVGAVVTRPGRIDPGWQHDADPFPQNEFALRVIDLVAIAEKTTNKAVCTEADMLALRKRVHVTQEDFEMAVSKVMKKDMDVNNSLQRLWK